MTIYERIAEWGETSPEAPAILAPDRESLSFSRLHTLITETAANLRAQGIQKKDRVALVLPNGPEMATAFLAISSCCVCAPLNPSYTKSEFEFYLSDLRPKAIVLMTDVDSEVHGVAESCRIQRILLKPAENAPAGCFRLLGDLKIEPDPIGMSQSGDVALLLHTSGTTSRPKIVPLTHLNLSVSAENISISLRLGPRDRSLNVMPLFHIHGLVAGLISPLFSGGSVICTPGFYSTLFFDWIRAYRPTWYTAVPTMHQILLERSRNEEEVIRAAPLRFIRSCSSAMPTSALEALESHFGVPVVEAYGMTECSHQISTNPLPPAGTKAGSVGLPAGMEVVIMDASGRILSTGERGEIAVRGLNVTSGYESNPDANRNGFCNGWFRTGDQGYIDKEGYLFISGRLKEIINRGGEKISPREVEEVLLEHPGIKQALVFAVPHAQLGEVVGAAVVPGKDGSVSERDVRDFASRRLSNFKLPVVVKFLGEIPKGPTGKPQRIGLAGKLGIESLDPSLQPCKPAREEATSTLQKKLVLLWSRVLRIDSMGIGDDFFSIGGDSVLAAQIISGVRSDLNFDFPLLKFMDEPTIAGMARHIAEADLPGLDRASRSRHLIPIQPEGDRPPIFGLAGIDGSLRGFCNLARHLRDQPLFAFMPPQPETLDEPYVLAELARKYVHEMRSLQQRGPYILLGNCFGGFIAQEMAHVIEQEYNSDTLLIMLDTFNQQWRRSLSSGALVRLKIQHFWTRTRFHLKNFQTYTRVGKREYLIGRLKAFLLAIRDRTAQIGYNSSAGIGWRLPAYLRKLPYANRYAEAKHVRQVFAGKTELFRATNPMAGIYPVSAHGWAQFLKGPIAVHEIPGDHLTILDEPTVEVFARRLEICLGEETPLPPAPASQ